MNRSEEPGVRTLIWPNASTYALVGEDSVGGYELSKAVDQLAHGWHPMSPIAPRSVIATLEFEHFVEAHQGEEIFEVGQGRTGGGRGTAIMER